MESITLDTTHSTPVIILGTGGFAIELAGLLHGVDIQVCGFIGLKPHTELPASWLGDDSILADLSKDTRIIMAIGNLATRRKVVQELEYHGFQITTFIHPDAYVSPRATLAQGCVIYPNVTVHSGVTLGKGVLVNSNATIGHETTFGDFSNIGPGASIGGCCQFGSMTYIGIGVSIKENLKVVDGILLGAGATLVSDALEIGTYIGVPAKKITS
jgi:sugar O-acyltransferase (sialic acid O-acetyltransferase NeuD family)